MKIMKILLHNIINIKMGLKMVKLQKAHTFIIEAIQMPSEKNCLRENTMLSLFKEILSNEENEVINIWNGIRVSQFRQ